LAARKRGKGGEGGGKEGEGKGSREGKGREGGGPPFMDPRYAPRHKVREFGDTSFDAEVFVIRYA